MENFSEKLVTLTLLKMFLLLFTTHFHYHKFRLQCHQKNPAFRVVSAIMKQNLRTIIKNLNKLERGWGSGHDHIIFVQGGGVV